jgi:hypothetical protein
MKEKRGGEPIEINIDEVLENGPRRILNDFSVVVLCGWVGGTDGLNCRLPADGKTTFEEAESRAKFAFRSTVVSAILAGKICSVGPGVFCKGEFDDEVVSPIRLEKAISNRNKGY